MPVIPQLPSEGRQATVGRPEKCLPKLKINGPVPLGAMEHLYSDPIVYMP